MKIRHVFQITIAKIKIMKMSKILRTTAEKFKTINYYVPVVIIYIIVAVKQKEMQSLCADIMWLLFIIFVSTIAL